jgi:hypothetical protein
MKHATVLDMIVINKPKRVIDRLLSLGVIGLGVLLTIVWGGALIFSIVYLVRLVLNLDF